MAQVRTYFAMLCALAMAFFGYYSWFTFEPLKESDYTVIEGKLKSYAEKGETDSRYLDLHLKDNELRFRVDINAYKGMLNRQLFKDTGKIGMSLSLAVEKTMLREPLHPAKDGMPTVFISAMGAGNTVYFSLADKKAWLARNRYYALLCAIIGTAISIFLAYVIWGSGDSHGLC